MAGLYLFKTGFGGRIVHRIGAVDVPLNAPAYHGFRLIESARLAWYKGLKKTLARIKRGQPGGQRKTLPSKA
jgi:lipid II:glycine glycyltransferase (peptidoglycan interpeptide bridge formation enzyme)